MAVSRSPIHPTGLIVQDQDHGSLKLTPKAYDVFKGEPVLGLLPQKAAFASRPITDMPYDKRLFDLLRAKRTELAQAGNVPPYVIFSDRSLADMAIYFPQSRQSFAAIYGVGEAKLQKYAGEFLPIIQSYCQENQIQEKRRPVMDWSRQSLDEGNRTEQVADAYNAGRTVNDLALELGIKKRTVINHLWKTARARKPLRSGSFIELSGLPAEEQDRVLAAFAELGTEFLKPIYDKMEGSIGYDELHILRLHFVSTRAKIARNKMKP